MPPDAGEDRAELTQLASGWRVELDPPIVIGGVAPAGCVRPSTIAELEQIVGWASLRGLKIAAVGAGTKLGIGNPPSRLDLVLDMTAMDSIVEYDVEDLVLTAQAGASIGSLRTKVHGDSLVVPLDPRSGDRATLGGVIACADHGPRRQRWGGLRDVVLGLKVVLADGSLANFGGRTLKNVAGYDVGKLFIGSLGSIGIVVEATVRLLPAPMSEELLFVFLAELSAGRRLVARILGSPLLPSSLELMSSAYAALSGFDRPYSCHDRAYLMLFSLEGHPAAVQRQVRDISRMCSEAGSESDRLYWFKASDVGLAPAEVWEALSTVREKALAASSSIGLRCTLPLVHVWDLAASVEESSLVNGVTSLYTASCGTGYLELCTTGSPSDLRAFAETLRAEAEKLRGAVSVLDGWSLLGEDFDAWGSRRTDFGLMQAVKTRFDPGGIMNPGRFVGGL